MELSRISICSQRHRKAALRVLISVLGGTVLWLATAAEPAPAATLCVKAGGGGKCFGSIQAAVTAAAPGDTINVAHGTYTEDVLIAKSISLVGENAKNTIIDATGKLDAITVGTPPTAKAPSIADNGSDDIGIHGGKRRSGGNLGRRCLFCHDLG